MGRPSRRSELHRYRRYVLERLADRARDHDPVVPPGFTLTDQDVADVQAEVERELREEPRSLLLVTCSTRPGAGARDEEEEPGFCLGLRFCFADDVARVERLLVQQVRRRYVTYRGLRPREVRRALLFTVWEVPQPPARGGWPRWIGPTGWYL